MTLRTPLEGDYCTESTLGIVLRKEKRMLVEHEPAQRKGAPVCSIELRDNLVHGIAGNDTCERPSMMNEDWME